MNFCKHRYGTAITPDDSSYDVFNIFKKGNREAIEPNLNLSSSEQYHFGVVVEYDNTGEKDPKARAVGIVTLEDIIEEMIQEEIVDETDVFSKFLQMSVDPPEITLSQMSLSPVSQLIIVERFATFSLKPPTSPSSSARPPTRCPVKSPLK